MGRFKDFGEPVTAADSDEPVVFKIYGETFHCRKAIQGRTLISLLVNANVNNMAESAGAVLGFFDKVLLPESNERFVALCEDENRIVPLETFSQIMEWLVEQYSGTQSTEGEEVSTVERPTVPSSDSSPGPEITGLPLMAGQYSPVAVS